ncbi:unnamed protein product, partial [Discosporangium mesarthrocarpum]
MQPVRLMNFSARPIAAGLVMFLVLYVAFITVNNPWVGKQDAEALSTVSPEDLRVEPGASGAPGATGCIEGLEKNRKAMDPSPNLATYADPGFRPDSGPGAMSYGELQVKRKRWLEARVEEIAREAASSEPEGVHTE